MNEYEIIEGNVLWPTKEVKDDCSIGFLMDHKTLLEPQAEKYEKKWFNYYMNEGQEAQLEAIRSQLKGAHIKFKFDGVGVTDLEILGIRTEQPKSKKQEDSNIINIKGKDFMTYEGLLNKAHKRDEKFSMEITESWVSEDMTRAWCKVRLSKIGDNQVFDGFGSSTPENTGDMTSSHPVEMAHTRAKGRALRDYLNIGQVMAEELK